MFLNKNITNLCYSEYISICNLKIKSFNINKIAQLRYLKLPCKKN